MGKRLLLKEAFENAKQKGITIRKKELAHKLWPNATRADVNMSNLLAGRTTTITVDMVRIICEELDTEPNNLFNIKK